MSDRTVPIGVDAEGPRRSVRAPGLLAAFSDATVLDAADVHTATTLDRLGGSGDPSVALAAAFAVRAVRQGSVHVDLATVADTVAVDEGVEVDVASLPWPEPSAWIRSVATSTLVATGDDGQEDRPLRLLGSTVALDRYWRHERRVAADLAARAGRIPGTVDATLLAEGLERLFRSTGAPDLQRIAAAAAVLRSCSVIAGGPGTGKTTTVARVLALLHEQAIATGSALRVALAAPTGKAAARLQESVRHEAASMDISRDIRSLIAEVEASTIHRLLGSTPSNRSRFRHDRRNQLPHQVVIIDETSMVSLSMMSRLLEAVRPSARLVLVGDPQQLASVEAGAVLGDLIGPTTRRLRMRPGARAELESVTGHPVEADLDDRATCIGDGIVVLRDVHRFAGGIGELARAVERAEPDAVIDVLVAGHADVRWIPVDAADPSAAPDIAAVRDRVVDAAASVIERARAGDGRGALDAVRSVQVLCAHRHGVHGVSTWRREVERQLAATVAGYAYRGWFAGRPLLVTENDRHLRLYNGDTGVAIEIDGQLRCAFDRGGELLLLSPSRLAAVETLYAMTIHKSQGSQFGEVVVVLPDESSPILTRELLYTAVTRAERVVTVIGTESAVRAAVGRPVNRASGLGPRLWGDTDTDDVPPLPKLAVDS